MYLPTVRVACTPYQGALRVAGTMEFRGPDDPVVPARVRAIVASAAGAARRRALGRDARRLGRAAPVTPTACRSSGEVDPGVYVAGGHGMWGLAHGPVTGRLLAEQITTGKQPDALAAFEPSR